VIRLNVADGLDLHNQIVHGIALSPYRYRVLVPVLADIVMRVLSVGLPGNWPYLLAYTGYAAAAIFLLLAVLYIYASQWASPELALIGVLFVAGTMPIALKDHVFQPWSLLEAFLFTFGLLAIYRKQYLLLAVIVALASLNRETGIFIPLAFLFANLDVGELARGRARPGRQVILLFAGYVLIWAIVFLALRLMLGSADSVNSLQEILGANLQLGDLARAVFNWAAFLGVFWVFAVLGFGSAAAFHRRLALLIPFYLAVVLIFGSWKEVRLLMPLYPLLLPLALAYLPRFIDPLGKNDHINDHIDERTGRTSR
jgi:hypothetical protein